MPINLSFCNDCDLMSWKGHKAVSAFLESVSLPAGDSFWLFDPSGSDMALFTYDLDHKGPYHNQLLDEIAAGRLDVLHSAGSYSARFNMGYRPVRKLVAQALDYLAKYTRVPHIWTNHGDVHNIQNIGGMAPAEHHRGDDPGSDIYILDLLLDYGFEYFWLDRLIFRDRLAPYRILSSEPCRSGHTIKTFARSLTHTIEWSPNGNNLYQQLAPEELQALQQIAQNVILYTHWGCHHEGKWAYTPEGEEPLSMESRKALEQLAAMYQQGVIQVLRLEDFLKAEEKKPLVAEAQRIGSYVVRNDQEQKDNFYFNQYKRGVAYYQKRIEQLDISGVSALDAGCGVGQWSFALSEKFQDVVGIDIGDTAYKYLVEMTEKLRQTSPRFYQGHIEKLPFDDQSFDFVFCHGVIMSTTAEMSLRESFRVLKPGGKAYICLNGDGWYEYAYDIRFRDDGELRGAHFLPLWHAWYERVGGSQTFSDALQSKKIQYYLHAEPFGYQEAHSLVKTIIYKYCSKELHSTLKHYSNNLMNHLGHFFRRYLFLLDDSMRDQPGYKIPPKSFSMWLHAATALSRMLFHYRDTFDNSMSAAVGRLSNLLTLDVPKYNRAYLPHEFAALARSIGFVDFQWAPEGNLTAMGKTAQVPPMYDPDYSGQVSVWECLLKKPMF